MKKMHNWRLIILSLIFLLVAAGMAFADTWYVSDSIGSDSNPGTETEPFATIIQAVESANNEDTILVDAGTYSGDIVITQDGLSLRSRSTWGAVIDGESYGIQLTGNGLTVEDFEIQNSTDGIVVSGDQTADVAISSNWFSDITDDGIYFYWDAAVEGCSVTIEDNVIYSSGNGIYMEGDMGKLEDVDIHILDNLINGPSTGILFNYLYGGSVEISDNSLNECSTSGIYVNDILSGGEEISVKIENNDIDFSGSNGSQGIYMYTAERTTWINGNTVTGDYDYGIRIDYPGYYGMDPLLVYVEDNQIDGCDDGIYMYNLFEDMGGSIYISDNTIADCLNEGINLRYIGSSSNAEGFNIVLDGNVIFNCLGYGMEFYLLFDESIGEISVRGNTFSNNSYGIHITDQDFLDGSVFLAENNNFENNDFGFYNGTDILVSALNNWWGDPSGPFDPENVGDNPSYDNPGGLGDQVSELVDYNPWRDSPYIAGEESSGGCSTGGFDPALILLILPLLGLFSLKRNR